jgi:hypothetical protein
MPVDVLSETFIDRSRDEVAAYAANPDHAPEWYVNIEAVHWETPPPLEVGSRVAFVAHFLGRRLAYTAGEGRTRMTLRNRGEPSGFAKLAAFFMVPAMRRANHNDLGRLKMILEGRSLHPADASSVMRAHGSPAPAPPRRPSRAGPR